MARGFLQRSDHGLKIGIGIAFVYCLSAQIILTVFAGKIGAYFVQAPEVVAEVARIMLIVSLSFFIAGPLMMIASYFQAIGEAGRAAILGLTKTYLFALPLTFLLPIWFGETGIWIAGPVAETLLLAVTIAVLARTARSHRFKWGLFTANSEVQT